MSRKAENVLDVDAEAPPRKAMAVDVEQAGSPQRRTDNFSLEDIKALLVGQTQEMRKTQKEDIQQAVQAAVARSEKSTLGALEEIKRSLMRETEATKKQIEGVAKRQSEMQAEQADMAATISKLESRPAMSTSTASTDGERKPALVFGGWPPKTKRALLLQELAGVIKDVAADEYMDESPWTAGPRKGVALASFRLREDEGPEGMRSRMLQVADLINKASVPTASTSGSCPVWCAVARERSQRLESGHASKLRRMLHISNLGINNSDTDYKEGSVYVGDDLIGSAVLPEAGDRKLRSKTTS